MIFTCKTTNLNKAIQTVQRAISSKPSTPIFSGIHLIADNNILEIQAMDLNMAIACSIEAEIQEKGEIVVSAKHFSELMRKLPGENVTIVKNKEEKVSFKTYWEVLKHNRALQMLVISESTDKLATSIAGNSIVGVMLYGIIIGDYAVMGRLSAITMIPNIILLVIGIMGARHSGQKKTYVATVYGCIAVQLAITLLLIFGDPTKIDLKSFGFMNIAFVVLIIALNGIRNIGSNMMIPMMADCTDYEVYRSGHYVPGLIATVYSFIDKLISSFATTVVGAFVAVIGYKNSVPQVGDASTPEILMITILLFCGMPILGWIASIIAMKFYPLTGEKMKEIEDSIAETQQKNAVKA